MGSGDQKNELGERTRPHESQDLACRTVPVLLQ